MALLKVIVIAVLVSPLPFVSANHYTAPLPKLQTPPPPTPVAPASYDQTKPNPGDQTQILKAIESLLLKRLNESFAHEDTTGRHVEVSAMCILLPDIYQFILLLGHFSALD